MASIVFSTIGGALGASALGPVGGMIGQMAGAALGGMIDNNFTTRIYHVNSGGRLNDLLVQSSAYGKSIIVVYGQTRVAGNIIWSLPISEQVHRSSSEMSGGKGGGSRRAVITHTHYSYSVTLAIAICHGTIDGVTNIWADAKLVTSNVLGSSRLYKGCEQQLPDPLIEAHMGVGKTPAYRSLAYIVLENFPLADYGNRIPNFTFEVKRRAKAECKQSPLLEEQIKSICMIPGSGEFVYDTTPQYKINGDKWQQGKAVAINQHNYEGKVDAVLALDQLQQTCPHIEWVAPVVVWFATSLDIADCQILPGVEFKQNQYTQPDSWSVAGYSREQGHQITLVKGRPIYGGTVADVAVLRYLAELRNRGLKIMFNPMIFVDLANKPWRGHITGKSKYINRFFDNTEGYNKFIIHYAKLVKGKVDAFIIGSEMVGLTGLRHYEEAEGRRDNLMLHGITTPAAQARDDEDSAISNLCVLAAKVRQILGPEVKITYAANWSEYHHAEGGWYNLDPLWAHPDIDFIGIDAYFPLTNQTQSDYDQNKIIKGWTSGEGYDDLAPQYAWKNIRYWWENYHTNPDGSRTQWQPKLKTIWFTEFGFPSVDLASNQPNIFYDPNACDGGFPVHSNGRVDFRAQRLAIEATIRQWADSEMIERMFLWTWDARPYPYWPNLIDIWADGGLWLYGHWVNGKFGICRLSDIISELCLEAGLVCSQFDASELGDLVDGYVVSQQQTIRATIETLQQAYFFEVIESDSLLKFTSRQGKQPVAISHNDLVGPVQIIRQQELELPLQYQLLHYDRANLYQANLASATICNTCSVQQITIDSKLVLSQALAKMIADINLNNIWLERNCYNFKLPVKYTWLEPGDLVQLGKQVIRVTKLIITAEKMIWLSAVASELAAFDRYAMPVLAKLPNPQLEHVDLLVCVLDLPAKFGADQDDLSVYLAVANRLGAFIAANLYYSSDGGHNYHFIKSIINEAAIGVVTENLPSALAEITDYSTIITVSLISGRLVSVEFARLLLGENLAIIGDEIIQFTTAKEIAPHLYQLSGLLRGRMGSEHRIAHHQAGERFILIDSALTRIAMPAYLLGNQCHYKLVVAGQNFDKPGASSFVWRAQSLRPLSVANVCTEYLTNGDIGLSWTRRARINGWWRNLVEVPLDQQIERYEIDIMLGGNVIATVTTDKPYCVITGEADNVVIYQMSTILGRGEASTTVIAKRRSQRSNL